MEVSSTNSEVTIKQWTEVKALFGTDYNKFAHRRLKWDRPDDTRDAIEQFVNDTVGLLY